MNRSSARRDTGSRPSRPKPDVVILSVPLGAETQQHLLELGEKTGLAPGEVVRILFEPDPQGRLAEIVQARGGLLEDRRSQLVWDSLGDVDPDGEEL